MNSDIYYELALVSLKRNDLVELQDIWKQRLGLGTAGAVVRTAITEAAPQLARAHSLPEVGTFRELWENYNTRNLQIIRDAYKESGLFEDVLRVFNSDDAKGLAYAASVWLRENEDNDPYFVGVVAYYILKYWKDKKFVQDLIHRPMLFMTNETLLDFANKQLREEGIPRNRANLNKRVGKLKELSLFSDDFFSRDMFIGIIREAEEYRDLDTLIYLLEEARGSGSPDLVDALMFFYKLREINESGTFEDVLELEGQSDFRHNVVVNVYLGFSRFLRMMLRLDLARAYEKELAKRMGHDSDYDGEYDL